MTAHLWSRRRIRFTTQTSLQARHSSTRPTAHKSNPYPYPNHSNPTPHQIFHLPQSASQTDVKTRYYDLVRIYHPDSPVLRGLPAETKHARFQAIAKAYDVLRGKTSLHAREGEDGEHLARAMRNSRAGMWRRSHTAAGRYDLDHGSDERWKDRVLMGAVIFAIGAFVLQTASTRREAISDALQRTGGNRVLPRRRDEDVELVRRDERMLAASDNDKEH